jgi:hypothetical protein
MEFLLGGEHFSSNFCATSNFTCKFEFDFKLEIQMIFESRVIKHCLAKD